MLFSLFVSFWFIYGLFWAFLVRGFVQLLGFTNGFGLLSLFLISNDCMYFTFDYVNTHFCETFFTSLIQWSPTYSCAQFMYYIIFYSFKHGPSPCNLLGKLRNHGLEDIGRFLSNLLHEPSTCVLPSGQGTLIAYQAHGGGLVPKIPPQNSFYSLADYDPKFLP